MKYEKVGRLLNLRFLVNSRRYNQALIPIKFRVFLINLRKNFKKGFFSLKKIVKIHFWRIENNSSKAILFCHKKEI